MKKLYRETMYLVNASSKKSSRLYSTSI